MDIEPPPKRRRKGESPRDQNEDQEDDELSFQPYEAAAQHDPDYMLSVERAYADQRFQATMSHIFEKYGRDFDGIGDEIDLETGEIVVNNGHVHNMRNEGDVGDEWGEEVDDEDEGFLLEDLIDDGEEEDNGLEENPDPDGQPADNRSAQDTADDGEENRKAPITSTTSTPSNKPLKSLGHPSVAPYTLPSDHHRSGRARLTNSPSAFALSPFPSESSSAAGPWDLPDEQFYSRDQPDLAVSRPDPAQRLPFKPGRYKFPVQDGTTSIWAPRSKFKGQEEDPQQSAFRVMFGPHGTTKRRKPRKGLPPPPPPGALDGDEDAIAAGMPTPQRNQLRAAVFDSVNRRSDEDVSIPSPRQSPPEHDSQGDNDKGEIYNIKHISKAVRNAQQDLKRKRRPSKDTTGNQPRESESEQLSLNSKPKKECSNKNDRQDGIDDTAVISGQNDGRRRSGRVRKQVDFLNKIPWSEVLGNSKGQRMMIELPHVDPISREDYERFENDTFAEAASTKNQLVSELREEVHPKPIEKRTIPDSQETPQSSYNNKPQENLSTQPIAEAPAGLRQLDKDSACVLSDDEAPTFLSKPRLIPRNKRTHESEKQQVTGSQDGPPPVNTIVGIEDSSEERQHAEAEELSPTPEIEPDENFAPFIEADDLPAPKQQPQDKNREHTFTLTSSPPVTATSRFIKDVIPPSDEFSDAAAFPSSPTGYLSPMGSEASFRDKPRRLGKEVAWLRRHTAAVFSPGQTYPAAQTSPNNTSGTQRKRGRPRRSSAANEQVALSEMQADKEKIIQDSITSSSPTPFQTYYTALPELPVEAALPSPRRTASPAQDEQQQKTPSHSPSKSRQPSSSQKPIHSPLAPSSNNPQTPRRANRHSLKIPSSRHSILSLLSDDENDEEVDELGRNLAAMPKILSSGVKSTLIRTTTAPAITTTVSRRIWKSSALTREIYRTPVKKRPSEPVSPGSLVQTPGGTLRACGMDGFRCGRDFCFTCL